MTNAAIVTGEEVFRILYYSHADLSDGIADAAKQYAQILASSRRNNSCVGVTGALMISGGRFAQMLEGPEAALRSTFERIKRDPRHHGSTVASLEPRGRRMFGAWAMALAGAAPGEATSLSQSASLEAAIVDPVHGGKRIVELLRGLARATDPLAQVAA